MNPRLTRQRARAARRGRRRAARASRRCSPPAAGAAVATRVAAASSKDVLNFSNWELYIDTPSLRKAAGMPANPTTLEQFTAKTGIKVNYYEDINGNPEYFATVQGRLAQRGRHRARHHRLHRQRQVPGRVPRQRLGPEAGQEPHPERVEPHRRAGEPSLRPEPRVHAAVVLGHGRDRLERGRDRPGDDREAAPRGPEAEGQGRRAGARWATPSASSCSANGDDPAEGHGRVLRSGAHHAARRRWTPGQIRKFYGNDYAQPLSTGDLAASFAWSGDIVNLQNPKLKWVIPDDGGDHLDRQHAHPARGQRADGVDVHELRVRPGDRRAARSRRQLHLGGQGRQGGGGEDQPEGGREHTRLPAPTRCSRRCTRTTRRCSPTRTTSTSG